MAVLKYPHNLIDDKCVQYVSTIVRALNAEIGGHFCHIMHSLDNEEYAEYIHCYEQRIPAQSVINVCIRQIHRRK